MRALAVTERDVLAGGWFSTAGGSPAANIARWNGNQWSSVGGGLDGFVRAIAVEAALVYGGGNFSRAGNRAVKNLACWDGHEWADLGGGVDGGESPSVRDLLVKDGQLYGCGSFTRAGQVEASNIARWDGQHWTALAGGLNGLASALTPWHDDVAVAGNFTQANGKPSHHVAIWHPRPRLRLALATDKLQLSWSAAWRELSLEESPLAVGGVWVFSASSRRSESDQIIVSEPATFHQKFFRLRGE